MKKILLLNIALACTFSVLAKKYESLSEALKNPSEVDSLVIESSEDMTFIEENPDEFRMLQNVVYLEIGNVWIQSKTLPDAVFDLSELSHFQLQFNTCFETIPASIGNCKNLKTFVINEVGSGTLKHTPIKTLPVELYQCTALEEIVLNCTTIESIPEGIGALSNLKSLNISFYGDKNNPLSPFSELPSDLANCTELEELTLINTSFKTFSPAHQKLLNLKRVVIRGQRTAWSEKLITVPFTDITTLSKLPGLEYVDLSCSGITEVPSLVKRWTNLTHLILADTRITSLPDELVNCTKLEYVNLIMTDIETFPSCLIELAKISEKDEILVRVKNGQMKDDKGKELEKNSSQGNYFNDLGIAKKWQVNIYLKKES